ncbi:MAG: DUF882 domain-containing protein [Pseudomonadota bacterium]
MTRYGSTRHGVSRRSLIESAFFLSALSVGGGLASPALARGMGDFRSLRLVNNRTGESIDCVYYADGLYIDEALSAFDFILRDWREEQSIRMDRSVIDILASVQSRLDSREPFEIVSGYRTPITNATLRRRSRGVAKKSYHTKGMAVDIAMKTRSVRQIAHAGLSLGRGGVGRYSRAQFVHLDSGPERTWGR